MITAMKREKGWMYTEYSTSSFGDISVVAEWWGEAPTSDDIKSGRVEIVEKPSIFA